MSDNAAMILARAIMYAGYAIAKGIAVTGLPEARRAVPKPNDEVWRKGRFPLSAVEK